MTDQIKIEEAAVVLTIHDAPAMKARGRKAVAKWLRKQADNLESDGWNYAKRFRARYMRRVK